MMMTAHRDIEIVKRNVMRLVIVWWCDDIKWMYNVIFFFWLEYSLNKSILDWLIKWHIRTPHAHIHDLGIRTQHVLYFHQFDFELDTRNYVIGSKWQQQQKTKESWEKKLYIYTYRRQFLCTLCACTFVFVRLNFRCATYIRWQQEINEVSYYRCLLYSKLSQKKPSILCSTCFWHIVH